MIEDNQEHESSMDRETVASEDEVTADDESGLFPISSSIYESLFYLFIAVWGVYLLTEGWGWRRRDRLFPVIALGLLLLLICVRFVQIWFPDLFPDRPAENESFDIPVEEERRSKRKQEMYAMFMLFWAIILPISVFFFGFMNVLVVFMPAFVYSFTRNVRTSLLTTGFSYVFVYVLFMVLLDIRPWPGYYDVPQLLPPLVF